MIKAFGNEASINEELESVGSCELIDEIQERVKVLLCRPFYEFDKVDLQRLIQANADLSRLINFLYKVNVMKTISDEE